MAPTFRVFVATRPHLRSSSAQMFYTRGLSWLEMLFDVGMPRPDITTELDFQYPEHWLNILEQRALLNRIRLLMPNVPKVDIVTHSEHIVCAAAKTEVYVLLTDTIDEGYDTAEDVARGPLRKLWVSRPGHAVPTDPSQVILNDGQFTTLHASSMPDHKVG